MRCTHKAFKSIKIIANFQLGPYFFKGNFHVSLPFNSLLDAKDMEVTVDPDRSRASY